MSRHFLLVQRPPVEGYPPTLNQIAAFSALGTVKVVDTGAPLSQDSANPKVTRQRISLGQNGRERSGTISNALLMKEFVSAVRSEAERGADVAIAYDMEAAAALLTAKRSRIDKVIIHLHEHALPGESRLLSSAELACRVVFSRLKKADLVVVPDKGRAIDLQSRARLATTPLVVMNCPPRVDKIPESKLIPYLESKRIAAGRIVHFQGSIGPDRTLETAIDSMVHWPSETAFVLVGRTSRDYVDSLLNRARNLGVENRILFLGHLEYSRLFEHAAGSAVGLTVLDPDRSPNFRYSAGASNKRFEYMALGIPQVTNPGPGMKEIFEESGAAILCGHQSARKLGNAISFVIDNPQVHSAMSAKARAAHLSRFNYEAQMAPLIDWILAGPQSSRLPGSFPS